MLGKPTEAFEYIRKYFESIGIDPDRIDYGKRPKNLPEDVDKAWDILDEGRKNYNNTVGVQNGE